MTRPIHRFFAIVPLLAMSISAMVYFFFGLAQCQLKIDAQEKIAESKNLSTIMISLKDFKLKGNNSELWYEGELYDISSYSIHGDIVTIVTFHDEQEESLVKSIADNFECDRYTGDNQVHIAKYRTHLPNDNKIKVTTARLTLTVVEAAKAHATLPYSLQYTSPASTDIPKPPPDLG